MTADLSLYSHFVDKVTSEVSQNLDLYVKRLHELQNLGINPVLFNTAVTGLAGEVGEFGELNKKLNWHGKDFTPELHKHLEKELGDIIFYWTMACQALNLDPNEVIKQNVSKLEARYPEGRFSVERAENRAEGDI
jgi:NTP pyrophosphatase (non-canonical NTP hydrolase)